jgi:hypothetical protein
MRNFRAPERRVRDVTRTRAGVTDETLPWNSAVGGAGLLLYDVTRTRIGIHGCMGIT